MKTLGLYLIIFGLGSFILNLFDLEFRILSWMDTWGTTNGTLIRLGLIVGGLVLILTNRNKRLEDQFPELREINDLKKEESSSENTPSDGTPEAHKSI